jgi:hypothetical protein
MLRIGLSLNLFLASPGANGGAIAELSFRCIAGA